MSLMPVADALQKVLAGKTPLPAEHVPLLAAVGRVLADDLVAERTQPPAMSLPWMAMRCAMAISRLYPAHSP